MVAARDDRDLSNKEKEHTHTHTYSTERRRKKKGREIKKTAKRVTDSTLPCYGGTVGKQNSVWFFKVNPSRNSAYRTDRLMENRSKSKPRKTRLNYPELWR